MSSRAVLLGVGCFAVGLVLCVALVAILGVSMAYLPGPAVAVGAASYCAYRGAAHDSASRS